MCLERARARRKRVSTRARREEASRVRTDERPEDLCASRVCHVCVMCRIAPRICVRHVCVMRVMLVCASRVCHVSHRPEDLCASR